jgi:hypothetical protein
MQKKEKEFFFPTAQGYYKGVLRDILIYYELINGKGSFW